MTTIRRVFSWMLGPPHKDTFEDEVDALSAKPAQSSEFGSLHPCWQYSSYASSELEASDHPYDLLISSTFSPNPSY